MKPIPGVFQGTNPATSLHGMSVIMIITIKFHLKTETHRAQHTTRREKFNKIKVTLLD